MITVISFIVVLGILVFFHELGHYWVARRNGIVVEEFGMGYPPRLVKLFTYDGTDFTLNLIPFGGFARMKGEDASDLSPGSFNAASRGARAATLIAGPAMNALLAVILFAASFMAGFPAVVALPQMLNVATNSSAAALGIQDGDILLQINGETAYVSGIPDFQYNVVQQASQEPGENAPGILVSRNDQIIELPDADVSDIDDLLSDSAYLPVLSTEISQVSPDSPAEAADLQPGDQIYAVDGIVVTVETPLNELIRQRLGDEVSLTVLRDLNWVTVNVVPRVDPPEGQGALGIQISPITTLATLPPLRALWEGVLSTSEYIMLVLKLPFMLIMGQLAPGEAQLTGPVGIAQMVGGAVSATIDTGLWFPIWRLSAVLSAALAITNLLPLPALDGGRLLFILVETLRGRRVNPEREGFIHMIGFMLLLGLLALITVRDISSAQEGIDWLSILGQ
ncbi:MAG: RIP metalloprotease RseP [Caldilineaceae bacterium]|nr:RIP metalloprotease RseP [Caldilineaceae bacterium]